jgi:hypothetical protein
MLRRRPDLIVPIHDRRQHRRFLTLKNFGWVTLAGVLIFIGISIRSEMRGPTPHGYGGLFDREVDAGVVRKPADVVREAAPVADATAADPMLIAPAARDQWLEGEVVVTTTVAPVTTAAVAEGSGDVTIVGGPEGLTIVRKERRKPVLSGGFGRQ